MRWMVLLPIALAGCPNGDKHCGEAVSPAQGVVSAIGAETFTYGNFTAVHAGDCGRDSITIDSTQVAPTAEPFHLVLCVQRADLVAHGTVLPLAGDFGEDVAELVDASARSGDCTYAIDFAAAPQGTASFAGYCDLSGESFSLTVEGSVGGFRTCTTDAGAPAMEPVTIVLSGAAAMLAQ